MLLLAFVAGKTFAQTAATTPADDKYNKLLSEAKAAIDKGNAQWAEGWRKGDANMVAAIFEDDGIQLSSTGKVIKGRKQIAARQKAAMQSNDPGVIVTVTTLNVWIDGETAFETGTYKYEYSEKGKPGVDTGHYVTQWRRQKDGTWKLHMDMAIPKD